MKRRLQPSTTPAQEPNGHADVSREPQYLLRDEAADFLRFKGPRRGHLFYKWAQRNRVPVLHRGRTLLYERRVLVAFLEQRVWTKQHAEQSGPVLVGRQR
jgi:hypothetical protein